MPTRHYSGAGDLFPSAQAIFVRKKLIDAIIVQLRPVFRQPRIMFQMSAPPIGARGDS